MTGEISACEISACENYRYWLTRDTGTILSDKREAVFVMLNPSTADAEQDDPTIRRCIGFARSWECRSLVVVNLYAFRATKPADLWSQFDPVGPSNNIYLRQAAKLCGDIVCAWGANAKPDRVREVMRILTDAGARTWCLGMTKDGAPRHPLYVKASHPLVPYPEKEVGR